MDRKSLSRHCSCLSKQRGHRGWLRNLIANEQANCYLDWTMPQLTCACNVSNEKDVFPAWLKEMELDRRIKRAGLCDVV